jgi:5-(carboxyamino)imidazole ribonucleotide mutase
MQVGIIMGSQSDLHIMTQAADMLEELGVEFELTVISAHRTPERMFEYAKSARERGLKVIIAGAGGAAHLPGMVASMTPLPVIGVPVKSSNSIDGWDSILSILQMPGGVPVATVALDGGKNAGILAAQMIGAFDKQIGDNIETYM